MMGTTITGRARTGTTLIATISNTTINPTWNGPKGGQHRVTTTTMVSNDYEGDTDNSE